MKKSTMLVSTILIVIGFALASFSVFYSYSYWWDEFFSVAAASMNLKDLYQLTLLPDVHPPLYTLLLHYWILIFGNEERLIRLFSFICAASSLFALYIWGRKRFNSLFTSSLIVFLSTSWLFSFYAQEARAYALMMFLSTIATIMYLDNWYVSKKTTRVISLLVCLILLSLTHYFGFIYAGLILLFITFECRNNLKKLLAFCLTGSIMFIWPINHFINGGIGETTGNNFWIKSDGFQSTISYFVSGNIPQISTIIHKTTPNSISQYIISAVFIALLAFIIYIFRNSFSNASIKDDLDEISTKSIFLTIAFIIIVMGVDYHSPISTTRNYIVILPLTSVIFALTTTALNNFLNFRYITLFLTLVGVSNLYIAASAVKGKVEPKYNTKAAVKFIENNASSLNNVYYLSRVDIYSQRVQSDIAKLYFSEDINIIPITLSEDFYTPDIIEGDEKYSAINNFYILMQQQTYNLEHLASEFKEEGIDLKIYIPQNNESVVVVYYDKSIKD